MQDDRSVCGIEGGQCLWQAEPNWGSPVPEQPVHGNSVGLIEDVLVRASRRGHSRKENEVRHRQPPQSFVSGSWYRSGVCGMALKVLGGLTRCRLKVMHMRSPASHP